MIEHVTIFCNTHTSAQDCWPVYFGQLDKMWPDHPRVMVGADVTPEPLPFAGGLKMWFRYSERQPFGIQYMQGVMNVETEFTLTMQEDYFLYDSVANANIEKAMEAFSDPKVSFVRLIDSGRSYSYSMQASIWRTEDLLRLYIHLRQEKTPWEAELTGCIWAGVHLNGVIVGGSSKKRGRDHYDSAVLPYTSSALVRGKWNFSEYEKELRPLLEQYEIDPSIRGTV